VLVLSPITHHPSALPRKRTIHTSMVPLPMQAAAAAALALLAARDSVIQDSLRFLGGIELLVGLLAAPSARVADAAKCALYGLRHDNVVNQDEVYSELRRWVGGQVHGLPHMVWLQCAGAGL
jgi:hypothetical protein